MSMEKPATLDSHKRNKENIQNANVLHKQLLSFNHKTLQYLSNLLGSPWVVYFFTIIALVGLTQVSTLLELVQWFSQTFVQFVALAIIQGRSNIQSQHDEEMTEMIYKLSKEQEKDVYHILNHQDYQNEQIEKLLKAVTKISKQKTKDTI